MTRVGSQRQSKKKMSAPIHVLSIYIQLRILLFIAVSQVPNENIAKRPYKKYV